MHGRQWLRDATAQAQQSAGCNASHSVEARMCRWLLRMRDLTGSRRTEAHPRIPLRRCLAFGAAACRWWRARSKALALLNTGEATSASWTWRSSSKALASVTGPSRATIGGYSQNRRRTRSWPKISLRTRKCILGLTKKGLSYWRTKPRTRRPGFRWKREQGVEGKLDASIQATRDLIVRSSLPLNFQGSAVSMSNAIGKDLEPD